MDAIDRVLMNSRLHYLGMAARERETALKLAVLTCMDARIDVSRLLGLQPGDAHVVRNAGGRATDDAIRSIALSQGVLGTREVMLIHHTDCALGRMTESQIAERISAATGNRFTDSVGSFDDPVRAVVEDVERMRSHPSLSHRDRIRGFIYDLLASRLLEVSPDRAPGA